MRTDFAVGINYPWRSYGSDFGKNAWGHLGLSSPVATTELDEDFSAISRLLQRFPTRVVRVFLFADGRACPVFDESGHVIGLDELILSDLDTLWSCAGRHALKLLPVLLDFHWCFPGGTVAGAQVGGRADVLKNAEKRRSLLRRAVAPLLERYGQTDQVFAWEIMNEPEWVIAGVPGWFRQKGELVTMDIVKEFCRNCTELIHGLSPHPVTLGSASWKWLSHWRDIGLDLYQFHWYPGWRRRFLWPDITSLGLDRPCLVGEVPTSRTRLTVADFLSSAEARGYSGVLFWSYRARDRYSDASALLKV